MKVIAEHLYEDGKKRRLTTRLRIPQDLRQAFGGRKHLQAALGTSDVAEGKRLHAVKLATFYAEFEARRVKLREQQAERLARASTPLTTLSADQVEMLAGHFVHQSLLTDDHVRSQGLDDEDFDALGQELQAQRSALGGLLARGRVELVMPALRGFMHLMGTEIDLAPDEERRVGLAFLQSVVRALDLRISRQAGTSVSASESVPAQSVEAAQAALRTAAQAGGPAPAASASSGLTWDGLFDLWRTHVSGRPESTTIAMNTAWRDLQRIAAQQGVLAPAGVTPVLMKAFVDDMRERGLAADTVNDRLSKVRRVFKLAVGQLVLPANPAADTIGQGKSSLERRRKPRRSFDDEQIQTVFGSGIFDGQHLRSHGNAGEATYWIPLIMNFSGMRPEEVAGLAISDIVADGKGGHYFDVVDRPDSEDAALFDDDSKVVLADAEPKARPAGLLSSRTLKNGASVRRVPVAQGLIDLGLLRYRDLLHSQGHKALFPTLTKDCHGKLGGAFGKFFGRYKRELGIEDKYRTLYSFRHNMKDLLERAKVPSKYLQRILGHTTGDGTVTDGYGSDLPYEVLAEHFLRVQFPSLPVKPWAPGRGYLKFPKLASERRVAGKGQTAERPQKRRGRPPGRGARTSRGAVPAAAAEASPGA